MMRKSLIIILFLFCSVFSFAQNQNFENWQEFSPDGEEFTVEVPQKLIESVNVKEVDENKYNFLSANYQKYFNKTHYFIYSQQSTPKSLKSGYFLNESLKSFIGEFTKEIENIKFGEIEGIKYDFTDSENFHHTIILVETDKRSYRFHAISQDNANADAARFIRSINFHKVLKPRIFEVKNNIISLNMLYDNDIPKSSQVEKPLPDSGYTTPLKITSKPSAKYTDLARYCGLGGTVAFQVTFLANGEIGEIITLKKLPLGLTASAVTAIKGIKFNPATKDGVAVTVTRQLRYSFTLY